MISVFDSELRENWPDPKRGRLDGVPDKQTENKFCPPSCPRECPREPVVRGIPAPVPANFEGV
jgi:hypothetical protein